MYAGLALFPIHFRVKQGGVLSPYFYCIYTDNLFTLLRKKKTGCWMEGKFVGILGYVDDLLLVSPSLDGLQEMIKSCGEHARSLNLSFSTNANLMKCKTKCMAFLNQERELKNITRWKGFTLGENGKTSWMQNLWSQ